MPSLYQLCQVCIHTLALVQQELLESEAGAGTHAYMAPEQWRGEALDARTDIYALGCMLYEMLTGAPPFGAKDVGETMLRRRHEQSSPPHLPAHLPAALDQFIHTCLRKEPDARFDTWYEVAAALRAVFVATQQTAPKPSAPYRPLSVEALNRVAITYYSLGDYERALQICDMAIRQNSAFPNSYTNRGAVQHVLGDREAALADYTRAIRLGRRAINAAARNNRGLLHLAQYERVRALRDLNEAVESAPDYANAHVNLGLVYLQLDRIDAALDAFNQALALAPTHVVAHHNRGYLLNYIGHSEAALQAYTAALRHDPTFLPARINRMLLYEELGHGEAAAHERNQIDWLAQVRDDWQDDTRADVYISRPDPQFVNTDSVEELIARPILERRREQRRTLENLGLIPQPTERMPLQAVVRVENVAYAEELHERVLARLDSGWRMAQLTLDVTMKQADGAYTQDGAVRTCGLWLDEETMAELAAEGLHSIADLRGRWLMLVNDYPDDITHPLRLHAVLL